MEELGGLIMLVTICGLYLLPALIAKTRGTRNVASVFVVNLFLGWTFIGWIVALAMAFQSTEDRIIIHKHFDEK